MCRRAPEQIESNADVLGPQRPYSRNETGSARRVWFRMPGTASWSHGKSTLCLKLMCNHYLPVSRKQLRGGGYQALRSEGDLRNGDSKNRPHSCDFRHEQQYDESENSAVSVVHSVDCRQTVSVRLCLVLRRYNQNAPRTISTTSTMIVRTSIPTSWNAIQALHSQLSQMCPAVATRVNTALVMKVSQSFWR